MWLLQSAYSNRQIGPFENLHRTSTNWSRIRRSLFWGRGRRHSSNVRCASLMVRRANS